MLLANTTLMSGMYVYIYIYGEQSNARPCSEPSSDGIISKEKFDIDLN